MLMGTQGALSPQAEVSGQDVCVPAIAPPPDPPAVVLPLLRADALEKKLHALQDRKPVEAFAWLRAELPRIAAATDSRTQLKLLELIRQAAEAPVTSVEQALRSTATLPPAPETMVAARAGCELLGELGEAYLGITKQLARWSGAAFKRPLRIAMARAMQVTEAQLRLAYRAYTQAPPSAWATLHALYALARRQGLIAYPVTEERTTLHDIYVGALLMAIVDPAELRPEEFDRVESCVQRCARFAELRDVRHVAESSLDRLAARFLVSPRSSLPSRFSHDMAKTAHEDGELVLDCGRVLDELLRLIKELEDGLAPRQAGELTDAPVRSYVSTLRKLSRRWAAPTKERHSRSRAHQRVELVCGFDPLWLMLAAAAARSVHDDTPGDLLPPDTPRSEWQILDERPGAMSLRYADRDAVRITVGELVGVRPRSRPVPLACVVRRVQCRDSGEVDIVIERKAPRAVPMTASVRAERHLHKVKVIVLTGWPGRTGVRGMLVPKGYAAPGGVVHLHEGRWASAFRVSKHIDRAAAFDFVTISPRDPAAVAVERTSFRKA
jgi:hypothetical protein